MKNHFAFRHLNVIISMLFCILMTGCGMSFEEVLYCGLAGQGDASYNSACVNASNERIDAENREIELHNSAVRESWKDTPLHKAVYAGDIGSVKLLISKGADVNPRGGYGKTPLHKAFFKPNIEIIELLLLNGADVNAKDEFGSTPLHTAASIGDKHIEIVRMLIQYGADVNVSAYMYGTPLEVAVKGNHTAIAALFEAHSAQTSPPASAETNSSTPLHDAVKDSDTFRAEELIAKGVYINRKDSKGNTPLHYGVLLKGFYFTLGKNAREGSYSGDMVKLLLSKGADLNITNNEGKTPLDLAIENNKTDVAQLLREKADSLKSKEVLAMENGYRYLQNKQFSEAEKEYTYVIGEARTLGESLKSAAEKKKLGEAEAAFKYLYEYMLLFSLHNRAVARSGLKRHGEALSDWQEVISYYETNGCAVAENETICMGLAEAAYMNSCSMKYASYVAEPSAYRNYFEEADRECSEALKINPTDKLAQKIKEEITSEKDWADALDGMLKGQ